MKEVEGRNEQFINIAKLKEEYMNSQNPIISIDVKKKEVIGDFYRDGQIYTTEAIEVYDHDFSTFASGKVIPHGIYDLKRNEGYICLGISNDTSEFACDSIEDWWRDHGKANYPNADSILILCDGGGSNSSRHFIFKYDLQRLVNRLKIEIRIAHYPPYTSKYNPIERKLFCHISNSWKGMIFASMGLVKELTEKTKTSKGLKVFATISSKIYETKRKASEEFMENLPIIFDDFWGKWNYKAVPNREVNI